MNVYLLIIVPKGFFPQQDTGRILGGIQGVQDTSFQAMRQRITRFVDIVRADPAVANVMAFHRQRSRHDDEYRQSIHGVEAARGAQRQRRSTDQSFAAKTGDGAGSGALSARRRKTCASERRLGNAQYQYTIQSDNLEDLTRWGPVLLQQMRKLPGLADVSSDQQNNGLQASLVYDRLTASRLGITPQLIDDTLSDAFGQRQVSTMFTQLNQYHVVMEVEPEFWQSPEGLKQIYVRAANGGVVPLSAFTALRANHGAARREPSGTVSRR